MNIRSEEHTGMKFFKVLENDGVERFRVKKVLDNTPNPASYYGELINSVGVGTIAIKTEEELVSDYTMLEPMAIATVSIAELVSGDRDIIVTLQPGPNWTYSLPDATNLKDRVFTVVRQCMHDVFSEKTGISLNVIDCPPDIDMNTLQFEGVTSIIKRHVISLYAADSLSDMLSCIDLRDYDDVMRENYDIHCKACKDSKALFLNQHDGWCTDVKTLLEYNAFEFSMYVLFKVTPLNTKLFDYLVYKDIPGNIGYRELKQAYLNDEALEAFSNYFNMKNIDSAPVIEYDDDICLDDFRKTKYCLVKDITNTLYLIVFRNSGTVTEAELIDKRKEELHSDLFTFKDKIEDYTDKYSGNNI